MSKVENSFTDELPIWHFDHDQDEDLDFMVYSDGSLGAGFKLTGVDTSCLTDENKNSISVDLENILIGSKPGFKFQFFYRLSDRNHELIQNHEKIGRNAGDYYAPVVESRINFFNKNEESKNIFSPEIYFFIRSSPQKPANQKFWESDKKFKNVTKDDYLKFNQEFIRGVKHAKSLLENASLSPQSLNKEEWFNLFYEYFNFSRSKKQRPPFLHSSIGPFNLPLSEQFLLTDLDFTNQNHIKIGNHYFRVITLKTLPEGFSFATMSERFLKLPFHFWLTQNIHVFDQKKELAKLEMQRRIAHSMASGAKNVSDIENESKLAHIEQLISELMEGSEKLIACDYNVIIWGESKEELEEKSDIVLSQFRILNQAEGVVETLPSKEAFAKSMPGSCELFRDKKMKSSNCAHLMPVYDYWRGNERPVCLLMNRDNVPFSLDPYDDSLPCWNGLVIGGTGSGKSFSLAMLQLMFAATESKLVWVDNGKSSENLVAACEGEFIDVDIDSGVCLNLFDLSPGEKEPSSLKVKSILAVLEIILKDQDKSSLPKREKALLEELIFKVYNITQGRVPILSDLKELLSKHQLESMRAYSEILYSWCGNTAYGKLLDGQSNIELKKKITAIEIKALDDFPDLKAVFMLIITGFVQKEAEKDLATPYTLIIDEAHRLFATESTRDFILFCYRVFRKYNAGIYTITQSHRDFLAIPEVAEAILPNTCNVIILRQRKIDWDDFQKVFDFNDAEVSLIKSLEIKKGEYSEFFLIQDENKAVLRLYPDPLGYWICTSSGKDKAKIEEYEKLHPNLKRINLLEKLLKEEKNSSLAA